MQFFSCQDLNPRSGLRGYNSSNSNANSFSFTKIVWENWTIYTTGWIKPYWILIPILVSRKYEFKVQSYFVFCLRLDPLVLLGNPVHKSDALWHKVRRSEHYLKYQLRFSNMRNLAIAKTLLHCFWISGKSGNRFLWPKQQFLPKMG